MTVWWLTFEDKLIKLHKCSSAQPDTICLMWRYSLRNLLVAKLTVWWRS